MIVDILRHQEKGQTFHKWYLQMIFVQPKLNVYIIRISPHFAPMSLINKPSLVPVIACYQKKLTHPPRRFDVFFDLCLNKWLSKQSRCRWFETPLRALWCYCNATPCLPLHDAKSCSSLLWRHNGGECVSNQQPCFCLLNRLFGVDQRKHQSFASLAFVWGIHREPVNSPHKGPVTRFLFDDVIMTADAPDGDTTERECEELQGRSLKLALFDEYMAAYVLTDGRL